MVAKLRESRILSPSVRWARVHATNDSEAMFWSGVGTFTHLNVELRNALLRGGDSLRSA